jgi:hypothetical protein
MSEYEKRRNERFTEDMEEAGYDVGLYEYGSYNGPSVRVRRNELDDVTRSTNMELRWAWAKPDSSHGDEIVIYPR